MSRPKKPETPHYHVLSEDHTNPARLKKERSKARELRKTAWWKNQIQKGICEYCGKKVSPSELTMDHRVPLARGGKTTKGNVVPACKECNQKKKLQTPVEELFEKLEEERKKKETS